MDSRPPPEAQSLRDHVVAGPLRGRGVESSLADPGAMPVDVPERDGNVDDLGEPLVDSNPDSSLMTAPPQIRVHCSSCEWSGNAPASVRKFVVFAALGWPIKMPIGGETNVMGPNSAVGADSGIPCSSRY
jgi:hypothetical protein